jgi:hypothetical protein
MGVFDVLVWIALLVFTFWAFTRIRENFRLALPQAVGGYELLRFDTVSLGIGGQEIISRTPFTCPPDKPDLDAGLCYPKCRTGYTGSLTTCRVDSFNRGVGTPVGLEPCPSGWNNDGLTCREPLGWNDRCVNWGLWWTGCATGGAVRGRLNGGGTCPNTDPGGPRENTERVDGLCYKKCPPEKPHHIPGMPYLCYAGGPLLYDRGVGSAPALLRLMGKYPVGKII